MHWKQAIWVIFAGQAVILCKIRMLDAGAGDSPDWTKIPLNTRTWVLFQVWGLLWSQTPEYFLCSIRNDPSMLEEEWLYTQLFVSQDCGHNWNKVQQW